MQLKAWGRGRRETGLPHSGVRPGASRCAPLAPQTCEWHALASALGVAHTSHPHLQQCITNSTREKKISSSLQLPDRVLNFLKDHFLMDGQVRSRLLLLQPQARYQRVTVHRVSGLHHTYDVLFLGTGERPRRGRLSAGGLRLWGPGQWAPAWT